MADINQDGILDLLVASAKGKYPLLMVWTNFANILGSQPGPHPAYSAPWPMSRGDAQHSGAKP